MHRHPPRDIAEKVARLQTGASPRVVDLFSGCGGMSLGFQHAGCTILAGIEKEDVRACTHALNFHPEAFKLHGKGRDITVEDPIKCVRELVGGEPRVDIIVGGPPCQAYARVGRAKLREVANKDNAHLEDERGQLHRAYIKWVEALGPVAVVMENVPDILDYGGENVAEVIASTLDRLGYEVRYTLLNAANYGVPQTRERWFLIAIHRAAKTTPVFPTPTHHFEVPVGYRGTRAHAARWGASPSSRPPHAVPLILADPTLPYAVSCSAALSDLPVISGEEKAALKRCTRDLGEHRSYATPATTAFQNLMRAWPGFETCEGVTAHVIRSLPRDYPIFQRMKQGDDYPAAYKVAVQLFEDKLKREPSPVTPDSPRWQELRAATVPPYDPDKFPNKWRKLERAFPSRTLMAHLSHDSYSHIHYDDRQSRTISVREAARLQSIPDGFQFFGAMNAAFGQIGNAVPALLASHVAMAVRESLCPVVKFAINDISPDSKVQTSASV